MLAGFGKTLNYSTEVMQSVLECYLQLDQAHTAALLCQAQIANNPQSSAALKQYQVEAAWQLSQWDIIEKEQEESVGDEVEIPDKGWRHNLAELLLALHKRQKNTFLRSADRIHPLSAKVVGIFHLRLYL